MRRTSFMGRSMAKGLTYYSYICCLLCNVDLAKYEADQIAFVCFGWGFMTIIMVIHNSSTLFWNTNP